MTRPHDVARCRREFPALRREVAGRPAVFLDGPAGSQVPRAVIEAVGRYLGESNANGGGAFATSRESDALLDAAHRAYAGFLGAADPGEIVFGANMTTMTLALARSIGRTLRPGDEVVVTRLDHDANVTPWVQAAEDAGAVVRHVDIRPEDCTLDLDDLRSKLGGKTRLVAVGCASNAVGTVNPVREIGKLVHDAGALLFLDAVHLAPHRPIDVAAWDCDFLACSAYKFFGPHVGILWGRRALLEELPAYKLRPAPDDLPGRWMTGTQNHEGIAGAVAAVEYLADVGFETIRAHEDRLAERLLDALDSLPAVRVWGIRDRSRMDERVPTVSFTHSQRTPAEIAEHLAARGIFVWSGNFYALPVTEALGLEPHGMVRVGALHYNTTEEIDRLRDALRELD